MIYNCVPVLQFQNKTESFDTIGGEFFRPANKSLAENNGKPSFCTFLRSIFFHYFRTGSAQRRFVCFGIVKIYIRHTNNEIDELFGVEARSGTHYMIQQKWPLQMICGQFFASSSFNFLDLCPGKVGPIVYPPTFVYALLELEKSLVLFIILRRR